MSEDKTKEMSDSRSFEGRVFARFDTVEIRIGKLEERQYDTKPIWEQALTAILDLGARLDSTNVRLDSMGSRFDSMDSRLDSMGSRFDSMDSRLDSMDSRLDSMDSRLDSMGSRLDSMDSRLDSMDSRLDSMDVRFDRVDARFDKLETDMDDGFRRVARKMDVLNASLLEVRAEQRYLDRRLEKIETQEKPS